MTQALIVLVTCPGLLAGSIAQALLEEGLAACVNVVPNLTSVFKWQGKIERQNEHLLIIKSERSLWKALQARVRELHTYETPEILCLAVEDACKAYLDWIASCLRSEI